MNVTFDDEAAAEVDIRGVIAGSEESREDEWREQEERERLSRWDGGGAGEPRIRQ